MAYVDAKVEVGEANSLPDSPRCLLHLLIRPEEEAGNCGDEMEEKVRSALKARRKALVDVPGRLVRHHPRVEERSASQITWRDRIKCAREVSMLATLPSKHEKRVGAGAGAWRTCIHPLADEGDALVVSQRSVHLYNHVVEGAAEAVVHEPSRHHL
eukprot:768269-Hanusia_phi.AAC.1